MAQPVLQVQNLTTRFHTRNGVVRAVEDVSFDLNQGEVLGIVGESGCGKSVTCYSMMGLIPQPPGRIEAGSAVLDGQIDLLKASEREMNAIRGKRISMIFQDPMTSLNPYLRISTQLIEPLQLHEKLSKKAAIERGVEALKEVGIPQAEERIHFYPHEFSGGMRQRVMIAMAMITQPDILIADEPTTALDVTVQAQILELIRQRQQANGSAVILITHDLGVVAGLCDRILVMYAGRVVETGTAHEVFKKARHPYTIALQRSIPSLGTKGKPLYTIPGLPPDLSKPIPGDAFALRKGIVSGGKWDHTPPPMVQLSETHWVRESDCELPSLEEVLREC
ncbi:MAG: ABC transporter ATP-binding protein [Opitutales bacterium]|nr:ABC transporter ATP-binding protein [Opitutales bacterium]